jgi:hypothetical protein
MKRRHTAPMPQLPLFSSGLPDLASRSAEDLGGFGQERPSVLEFAGIAGASSRRIPTTAQALDRLIDAAAPSSAIGKPRAGSRTSR